MAEAAVMPSPDRLRRTTPQAFITLRAGHSPSPELARDILRIAAANGWRHTSASAGSRA